jgi:ornithine cyclodeaminase/alanine dehydrogenase-like protein (mu-crystallin family)
MAGPILQLSADEVLSALDGISPISALIGELIERTIDPVGSRRQPTGWLTLWPAERATTGGPVTGMVMFEDERTGTRGVLSASILRSVRAAALASVAARELVSPGVVTAAVVGAGVTAQVHLAVSARHVPNISHIAFHSVGDESGTPVSSKVRDQLELDGIGLTVAAGMDQAVFGANLVIITSAGTDRLRLRQLSRGAVLVNASGADMPADLVEGVDEIYVDDTGMFDECPDRCVVHLASRCAGTKRITADLGQLLTGRHSPRRHADDVMLVELLSVDVLDVQLAGTLCSAALRQGIGTWLVE